MAELSLRNSLKHAAKRTLERLIRWGVPRARPRVVRRLPHDTRAFTQGLAWHRGVLYESTGGDTTSSVRAIDPATGDTLQLVPVEGDFAEGIAVLGEHLYQLAFVSGHGRVYKLPTLERAGHRHYEGEGWGLAATPQGQLLASDGTSLLRKFDESFAVVGHLAVRSHGLPVRWLNDLECVGDRVYANIYAASDLAHWIERCLERRGHHITVVAAGDGLQVIDADGAALAMVRRATETGSFDQVQMTDIRSRS